MCGRGNKGKREREALEQSHFYSLYIGFQEPSDHGGANREFSTWSFSDSGFLSLGTVDIWDQMVPCCGGWRRVRGCRATLPTFAHSMPVATPAQR